MRQTWRAAARWRALARAAWVVIAALNVGLFVFAIPAYLERLQTPCLGITCIHGQLSGTALADLTGRGVSLPAYAATLLTLHGLVSLAALTVAAVIFWRRPTDWAAFTVSLFLVTLPPGNVVQALPASGPVLDGVLRLLGWVTATNLPLLFYTFPDGRFVPRWTRWVAGVWAVLMVFDNFSPAASDYFTGSALFGAFAISFFLSLGVAQVIRFRRLAAGLERQQIKWVVFGAAAGGSLYAVLLLLQATVPALGAPGSYFPLLRSLVDDAFALALAVSLGLAILRYRLWDIDLLINRALVYATLTALLAMVYFGSVVALEGVLRGLTGQGTTLATVASTLLLAALFRPLRARVQQLIDRRFYRRRYDMAQVLAAFGARMRAEVDLDRSTDALVAVVRETVEPRTVGLWLRDQEHGKETRWPS